jgi:hypothetical protein
MIAANASAGTRAAIAACFVVALVGAVEWVSIHRGSSLAVEVSYFAIPAAAALALYRTWRGRIIAGVLLTALSLLTVIVMVAAFLTL